MAAKKRIAIAVAVLAAAIVAVAVVRSYSQSRPDLSNADRIAAGRPVYERHCASCHGANLEGQPNWTSRGANGRMPAPPHDDSGHTWHHPSEMLFAITKFGLQPPHAPAGYQSDMPAFGASLSDDDIWNVLAFIRSRWSERVRTRHDQLDQSAHRSR